VLCSTDNLCGTFNQIIAEIQNLELTEMKPIISNGFACVMHFHTNIVPCTIETLMAEIDKKTKEETKVKIVKNYSRAKVLIKLDYPVAGEKFETLQPLGRFTLRDEGKTISIGKILKYKLSN
jgi:peptide chain release factor subunit 3